MQSTIEHIDSTTNESTPFYDELFKALGDEEQEIVANPRPLWDQAQAAEEIRPGIEKYMAQWRQENGIAEA